MTRRPTCTVHFVTYVVWSVNSRGAVQESATGCPPIVLSSTQIRQSLSGLLCARHTGNLSLLGGCGPSLQLGDDVIKPSDHVRLFGVTIAADHSLDTVMSQMYAKYVHFGFGS